QRLTLMCLIGFFSCRRETALSQRRLTPLIVWLSPLRFAKVMRRIRMRRVNIERAKIALCGLSVAVVGLTGTQVLRPVVTAQNNTWCCFSDGDCLGMGTCKPGPCSLMGAVGNCYS